MVFFLFHGNRTIFGWDTANPIFDLENSRPRSWPRSNSMVTVEAYSSIEMFAFRFMVIGPFLAEIQQIPYLTLKIQGQGHGQGQIRWSYLRPTVQSMYVCFFCGNQQIPCLILKIKVNVTMKIDQNLIRSSCRSESWILPKMKEIRKFVLKLLREQKSVVGGGGVRTSI